MRRRAWVAPVLVFGAMLVALSAVRLSDRAPAQVVPATQRDVFSAERAFAHLQDLLKENVPHPAGSVANAAIGNRIVEKLERFGYEPQVQEGLQCSTLAPGCAFVRNIIAVRKGREAGKAVMVTAHYDSVPASAAAADDGAGVAVMLELAERLAQREPLLHDIVFLFSDGEEAGLLGATLFAEKHPLMQRIGLVLNVEARGVSGPALMFETGANNARLIDLVAAIPRPVTSSIHVEVYRRMPNDTDYSIYRRAGVPGLNFAFTRGASLYHSVRDDLQRLDRTTLQHLGESVSAVLMRAGETPWEALAAQTDATYVDIGALMLLRWPSTWNLPLALLGLAGVVALALWRAPLQLRSAAWALLTLAAAAIVALVFGWLLSWPLGHWPDTHPLDHPYPWPGRIALIAAGVLTALVCARWPGRRAGTAALLSMAWLVLAMLTIATALLLPGATYVCLLPVVVYAVAGLLESRVRRTHGTLPIVAACAAFFVAAYLALHHFAMVEVVLGFKLSHVKIAVLTLLIWPLLPLAVHFEHSVGSRSALLASAATTVLAALIAMNVPSHTVDRPRGASLAYVQDEHGAQWQIESHAGPGEETLRAMGFDREAHEIEQYGVVRTKTQVRPATSLDLPQPMVEIDADLKRDDQRIVQGRIRSGRSAHILGLAFAADAPLTRVAIEDQPVLVARPRSAEVIRVFGAGDQILRFEIIADPSQPLAFIVFDDDALPTEGEAAQMLAKRPVTAAPLQFGDHAVVLRRVTL